MTTVRHLAELLIAGVSRIEAENAALRRELQHVRKPKGTDHPGDACAKRPGEITTAIIRRKRDA